jgi:membrane-bound inhibitor of C-type lysozyme
MRPTLALLIASSAAAQGAPEGMTVTYRCAADATVAVAYLNPPGGDSYAVVAHAGALVPMKAGPTGSGVRYVSLPGTEPPLVWHTKGADAFLAIDDAGETMIAGDCRTADLP